MSENRRGDFFDSRCRVTSVESPATTSAELCQFHCTSLLSVCRNDHSAGTALLEILDCMHGYLRQTTKKSPCWSSPFVCDVWHWSKERCWTVWRLSLESQDSR